jgi:hypothetical protein
MYRTSDTYTYKNIFKGAEENLKEIQDKVDCPRSSQIYFRFSKVNREVNYVLGDLYRCFEFAEWWNDLTPVQRVMLKEYYTDKVLRLLELGSKHVSRSLPYRLREATPKRDRMWRVNK